MPEPDSNTEAAAPYATGGSVDLDAVLGARDAARLRQIAEERGWPEVRITPSAAEDPWITAANGALVKLLRFNLLHTTPGLDAVTPAVVDQIARYWVSAGAMTDVEADACRRAWGERTR